MEIVVILNAHEASPVILDTIDSILKWATNDILLVVDGIKWDSFSHIPVRMLEGFRHGRPHAPYRNVALGLKEACELWPNANWFCYCEYDCLFGSSKFKNNLEEAAKRGVWCLGNNYRIGERRFPLIEKIIGKSFDFSRYLLGCCVFYNGEFIRTLQQIGFFERFLYITNFFKDLPEVEYGLDISEFLYPSLATSLGGKVEQLASYENPFCLHWPDPPSESLNCWMGDCETFPMRWMPDLNLSDPYKNASIMHPLKEYDNPIRIYHRGKRE